MLKHRERWSARAGVSAALMALVAAGCGRAGSGGVDGEPRAVAVRFLDELKAGRLEPAWEGASTEFKSLMGVETLRDYVKTHPALKAPAEFAEARTIDRGGRAMAEYVFNATATAKAKARGKPVASTIKVLLASGDGGWKVEQLTVD